MAKVIFATERNLEDLERERPLTSAQKSLIEKSFKAEYVKPFYVYAIKAKDSRKKKFFELLEGNATVTKARFSYSMRPTTAFIGRTTRTLIREKEFVLQSGNYTVDVNKAFAFGDEVKVMDQRHYRSAIKEDHLFQFAEDDRPSTRSAKREGTIAEFYCKKLFKPEAASKIALVANDSITFLQELVKYAEVTANYYPVDPLINAPNLNPYNERKIIAGTLKEDHVNHPAVYHHRAPPPQRSAKFKTGGEMTAQSNYAENFTPDIFSKSVRTQLAKPIKNPSPFSQFPTVPEPKYQLTRQQYLEQCALNKQMGRKNREVFTAKTCL